MHIDERKQGAIHQHTGYHRDDTRNAQQLAGRVQPAHQCAAEYAHNGRPYERTDEQKRDYLEGKTIKLDGVPDKQGVPSKM